jgi:peptidoglycan/LPS O-acetylase OafA/YrhL
VAAVGIPTGLLIYLALGTGVDLRLEPLFAPLSLCGVAALAWTTQSAGDHLVIRRLAYLGENSLIVYIVHWFALAAALKTLSWLFSGWGAGLLLPASVGLALFLSLGLVRLSRKSPTVAGLFTLSRRPRAPQLHGIQGEGKIDRDEALTTAGVAG